VVLASVFLVEHVLALPVRTSMVPPNWIMLVLAPPGTVRPGAGETLFPATALDS